METYEQETRLLFNEGLHRSDLTLEDGGSSNDVLAGLHFTEGSDVCLINLKQDYPYDYLVVYKNSNHLKKNNKFDQETGESYWLRVLDQLDRLWEADKNE